MAFLAPHFDPDVFVSYSHGDPRGGVAPLRDWTRNLIHRLRAQIRSLEDEFDDLHVWFDSDLDPTAYLTEGIKGQVGASGVLLIVMSKRYLKSAWCKDELDWFRKQIQDRGADMGRVFVLRAQETDPAAWPEFLRDERGHALPGFNFFDPSTGHPLSWPDIAEPTREFNQELLRLHTALTKRLRELRERAARRRQAEAPVVALPPGAPHRIYLHAPPTSDALRADIDRKLKADGIVPLSAPPQPAAALGDWQSIAGKMRETARRCEALALLRADADDRFIGDLLDIGVDERERIEAARGSPLPCAVLDNSGCDLPLDVSPWGIRRFDVSQEAWRGEFRSWLADSRVVQA